MASHRIRNVIGVLTALLVVCAALTAGHPLHTGAGIANAVLAAASNTPG
ncbi:hypothetical protein [Nocardia araoensis]|nr:hypothetical protein [Nocardia araoensis]